MSNISNKKRSGIPKLIDKISVDINGKERKLVLSDLLSLINTSNEVPLIYESLVSQSSTSAPREVDVDGTDILTPFVNTLNATWSYVSEGNYKITSPGNFSDLSKIVVTVGDRLNGANIFAGFSAFDSNSLLLSVGTYASFTDNTVTAANDKMYALYIKIQVKP